MAIRMKRGVIVAELQDIDLLAPARALDVIFQTNGWGDVYITAGIDGNHLPDSRHYMGRAIDLRCPSVDAGINTRAANELKIALPQWVILLEGDHIHAHLNPTA